MLTTLRNALLYLAIIIAAVTARGQDLRQYQSVIETGSPVVPYLRQWNQRELKWVKDDYTPVFQKQLEQLGAGQPLDWVTDRRKAWDALPPAVKVQTPLDSASELVILAHFSEQAPEFNLDRDRTVLEAKLYAVLTQAQESAVARRSKQIGPADVFVAMDTFWTGLWPLCPKRPQNKPDRKK